MDETLCELRSMLAPVAVAQTPEVSEALDNLVRAVPWRHARRQRVAVVVLVAVVGLAGGTAAAGIWTTHTGRHSQEYGVDVGETLDASAPDFADTARALVPSVRLPAGQAWQPYVDNTISSIQSSGATSGVATSSLVQGWQMHAWCLWVHTWEEDPSRNTSAAQELQEAPGWPGLVIYRNDGIGNSVYDLADAIRANDGAAAKRALVGWVTVSESPLTGEHPGCSGYGA